MNTHSDLHFGALAIKNGYASSSEVELALEAQKEGPAFESETPPKLGEILVEMGTLTPEQIKSVLEAQARLREAEEAANGTPEVVKFDEIQPAALIQESGPTLTVNDAPLTGPRTLKAGDRLKAGELLFRFSGESIEIIPKHDVANESSTSLGIPIISPAESTPPAPVPAAESAPPAAAEAPAPPKPKLSEKILPVLRSIDGVVAKIPPTLHTQRKYVLVAALLGWIAFLLPWRIAGNGNSVLGIQGPGWLTALLAFIPVACTLFSRPGDPFTKVERAAATAASGLALLIGIVKFFWAPSYATGRGVGLYLGIVSAICLVLASAFARAGGAAAATDAPTLGMRLWKKLSGFLGSVSGKRAKELQEAMERRDGLLRQIGEAALEAHKDLPEAAAAIQAREALQKADQEIADPKTGTVKAKAAQKAADAKSKRAFAKLAQKVIDGGIAGQEAAIADLRAAEAKIKELS